MRINLEVAERSSMLGEGMKVRAWLVTANGWAVGRIKQRPQDAGKDRVRLGKVLDEVRYESWVKKGQRYIAAIRGPVTLLNVIEDHTDQDEVAATVEGLTVEILSYARR